MTLTALYHKHVPELRRYIIAGDVDGRVLRGETKEGAIGYVTLPQGGLTAWGSLKKSAALMTTASHVETKCFARFVVLTTTKSPDHLTVFHRKKKTMEDPIPLHSTDLIIVSNVSHEEKSHAGRHFHLNEQILTDGGKLGLARDGDIICEPVPPVGEEQFREAIEKALQKEEERGPNADCGPTGP
jgi:hypothetical protein